MGIEGMEQLINTLDTLSKTAVPRASNQAVNKVAAKVRSVSVSQVAKETRVPRKLVAQRCRLKKAGGTRHIATIKVNRGNLPAIKLGVARMQLSRKKRDTHGAGSVLKVGRFTFRGAFIQQLKNGRWHVMQRVSKSRYPIDVVKIPMSGPLTEAFYRNTQALLLPEMDKAFSAALKNQLRLELVKK